VKTPRDISGAELAKALGKLGYAVTRQTGSHLRATIQQHGEHHEVVPNHSPIKIGTFKSILRNVQPITG
jgi:predicted RNA binding protein YcfA (HicA-like mRNA interferase family)